MKQTEKKRTDLGKKNRIIGVLAIQNFMKLESAGGVLIMLAAVVAVVLANSPLAEGYHQLLETHLTISFGEHGLSKSLLHWINDGLMAVFFLLVGMEIKRELIEGELSSRKQAILPFFAALGGMVVPAVIFSYVNWGNPETVRGWAIPSATDIAFALAVLTLLGSRVPLSLKVFLTAVAVIDDLGAVVIIALFYTADISITSLAIAAACFAVLVALNLRGVNRLLPYLVVGAVMWLAVLESGVHATIAGVLLGFTIPLRVALPSGKSMLQSLEHRLHGLVAYVILPLFAVANAGVDFSGITLERLQDPVPLGIACGLFFGKQIGILAFSSLLIKAGIAQLPERATWLQLYAVCILCGIGFTMSLFIGGLAFHSELLMTETRLGVVMGSLASGIVGYRLLAFATRRP